MKTFIAKEGDRQNVIFANSKERAIEIAEMDFRYGIKGSFTVEEITTDKA